MGPQLKALEPSLAEKPAALAREDQRDMRVLGASRTAFRTANGHSGELPLAVNASLALPKSAHLAARRLLARQGTAFVNAREFSWRPCTVKVPGCTAIVRTCSGPDEKPFPFGNKVASPTARNWRNRLSGFGHPRNLPTGAIA